MESSHATSEHASEHGHGKHSGIMDYTKWAIVLAILMGATIGASYLELGSVMNNIVAVAIATVKAVIVVLNFMQVKNNSKLTWIWAAIGFIWLIFLFGTFGDYFTRHWMRVGGWQ